ncbi:C-type isolectin Sp-CL4-like [Clinocottus analis]|uniref:C-type isolectin Sp-CL4-like n=1 Tax=Clinocottus analis TaxID=304258 RepID=UPI0035BEC92B
MHLTVLTAVLLSVGFLGVVTARPDGDDEETRKFHRPKEDPMIASCSQVKDVPCGDGWSHIDDEYCVKYFETPKSYDDAQKHCESLKSELVSIETPEESINAICLTMRTNPEIRSVWIGIKRSGEQFQNADGTEVYDEWFPGQPDNFGGKEDCVEMNHKEWGLLNDDNCSDENAFMCAKKM